MSRHTTLIGLVAALVVLSAVAPMSVAASEHDVTIEKVDSPNTVTTDESFDIDVTVSGSNLNGDEITITFDTSDAGPVSCENPVDGKPANVSTGTDTVTFGCEASAAGDYSGAIEVKASGVDSDDNTADDSTRTGLTVTSPASLSLTTSLDTGSIDDDESTSMTVSAANTGDESASYELSVSSGSGLSTSLSSGSADGSLDGGETVFATYDLTATASGNQDITVTLTSNESEGGNGQELTATETVSVQETGGDDGSTTTTTTTTTTDDEETETENEDEESSIADVVEEISNTEPNTETEIEIEDSDGDESNGVSVETDETTETVDEITFEDTDVSGTVEVREYTDPPESVTESIAETVAADVVEEVEPGDEDGETGEEQTDGETDEGTESGDTEGGEDRESGDDGASSVNVVSVADISISSGTDDGDTEQETAATVRMSVSADELDEPTNALILHETDDGWEELETTVDERADGEVSLEARTDSFSLFAVAEIDDESTDTTDDTAEEDTETTNETDTTDDTAEEDTESTDDGLPGFGVTVALVSLLSAGLLALRRTG